MPLNHTARIVSANSGWLPANTGWAELEELRERHLAAIRVLGEASDARSQMLRRHESEDFHRQKQLREAAATGELIDLPYPDPAEREMELAPLDEQLAAARGALDDLYTEAKTTLKALEPELGERIRQIDAEAAAAVEQARAAVIAAETRRGQVRVLAQWFDRTVNKDDDHAYAFHDLPIPAPDPEPDWAAILGGGSALEVSHA